MQNTYSNENRHLEYTRDCIDTEQEFSGASGGRGRKVGVEPRTRELRQPWRPQTAAVKNTLKKKFPFVQTLSCYFSTFNLSNIGGFSCFWILKLWTETKFKKEKKICRRELTSSKKKGLGTGKFYRVVLFFIKLICSLYFWIKQDTVLLKVYRAECLVYHCVLNRWLASTSVNAKWLRFQGLKWPKAVHLPDGKWWIWRHTSESSSKKHEYTGNKNAQSKSCHWEERHLWERIS